MYAFKGLYNTCTYTDRPTNAYMLNESESRYPIFIFSYMIRFGLFNNFLVYSSSSYRELKKKSLIDGSCSVIYDVTHKINNIKYTSNMKYRYLYVYVYNKK